MLYDLVAFQCSAFTHFRVCAGTKAFRKACAQLNFVFNGAVTECLSVGVANDEVYPMNALAFHVVHCIAAATAHANHLDDG